MKLTIKKKAKPAPKPVKVETPPEPKPRTVAQRLADELREPGRRFGDRWFLYEELVKEFLKENPPA